MKKSILLFLAILTVTLIDAQPDTVFWRVDNLSQIDGHTVQILGNPTVIQTGIGDVVEFNGIDDGLILSDNPVAGATAFTIEIIFKAYTGGGVEQRFLHFQQDNDNRILIELRNNNDENWSLDTFIKSGSSSFALLDYSYVHPLDEWTHAALIYKDGKMEHYVNGEKELEGNVNFVPVTSGQTSLGVRLNQVSWFKGAIHSVRVTHEALNPEDFMEIEMVSDVESVEESEAVIGIFPNPLLSVGQLKYQLKKPSDVSIKLHNIQGEELATLFEGFKNPGTYELEFRKGKLSPGVYPIVFRFGNKRIVRKLLLH